MKASVKLLALAAMLAAGGAQAQSKGQYTVKVSINELNPHVTSGNVTAPALPNSKADVGPAIRPNLVFSYGLTDNISAQLDLGWPYKHTIYGAGALEGTGALGSVVALPPTAFIQYRFFKPDAVIRPYVGLGATAAIFRHATGSGQLTALTNIGSGIPTTFKIKNKLAATAQVGIVFNLNEKYYFDVGYTKTKLKTKVTFSTNQTQDMQLDPSSFSIGVGRKF